nr:uncharacterized protein LOC109780116 [Aegilops tauschii subsp. strangulata]
MRLRSPLLVAAASPASGRHRRRRADPRTNRLNKADGGRERESPPSFSFPSCSRVSPPSPSLDATPLLEGRVLSSRLPRLEGNGCCFSGLVWPPRLQLRPYSGRDCWLIILPSSPASTVSPFCLRRLIELVLGSPLLLHLGLLLCCNYVLLLEDGAAGIDEIYSQFLLVAASSA